MPEEKQMNGNSLPEGPELWREQAKQILLSPGKTPEERKEGLRLMLRACDAGDPEAMTYVGKRLLDGSLAVENGNSVETAVSYLCRAARAGYFPARTRLLAYRRARFAQTLRNNRAAEGPLKDFDGKEIRIRRTGILTPVDAVLAYENGVNVLTLSLNLLFMEDEAKIPDVKALHEAVIRGVKSWEGDYTVFGGQKLHVDIHVTEDTHIFDCVTVWVCSGDISETMVRTLKRIPTKSAKNTHETIFGQNRAAAGVGMKKWSVRSRKQIFLQTRNGRFDDYDEITGIMRHEFGHVLGLGDLYRETERDLEGVPAGTYPELDAYVTGDRVYDLVMHHDSGRITGNDMEMVVLAFSKNQPQAYQPGRYVKIVSEALGRGN